MYVCLLMVWSQDITGMINNFLTVLNEIICDLGNKKLIDAETVHNKSNY